MCQTHQPRFGLLTCLVHLSVGSVGVII